MVVDHVEREIDDRSREAGAVLLAHVAVVEVQTPRAEDLGGEVELLAPVGDDGSPEKALRPLVHLGADFFGDAQEAWVFGDRELEIALVVERHGIDLPEGVLAIEHPAVSAREQSVSDVAQAALGARPWPSGRPGALDPLAHQIGRDLAPVEVSVAGVLNADARSRNQRLGIEEGNALPAALPRQSPRDAPCHQLVLVTVERRQNLQRLKRRRAVDLGVRLKHAVAVIESSSHLPLCTPKLMLCMQTMGML